MQVNKGLIIGGVVLLVLVTGVGLGITGSQAIIDKEKGQQNINTYPKEVRGKPANLEDEVYANIMRDVTYFVIQESALSFNEFEEEYAKYFTEECLVKVKESYEIDYNEDKSTWLMMPEDYALKLDDGTYPIYNEYLDVIRYGSEEEYKECMKDLNAIDVIVKQVQCEKDYVTACVQTQLGTEATVTLRINEDSLISEYTVE